MAGVERVSVHVSRLAHCPDVFFVEFSRAGSVGNLVVPLDRSEAEARPAFVDVDSELGRHGWLASCRRCCWKHGVYFVIRDWRRRPFRWCFLPERFANEANKFFDDERARPTDDCQYCANRHDPVRVTHVDVLKPIRNSIHDVQSTTGGVSCRI